MLLYFQFFIKNYLFSLVVQIGSSSETKLRATRVCLESEPYNRKSFIKSDVQGIVVREPKKDAAGIISLLPSSLSIGHRDLALDKVYHL
jgi:hypothetical protein